LLDLLVAEDGLERGAQLLLARPLVGQLRSQRLEVGTNQVAALGDRSLHLVAPRLPVLTLALQDLLERRLDAGPQGLAVLGLPALCLLEGQLQPAAQAHGPVRQARAHGVEPNLELDRKSTRLN